VSGWLTAARSELAPVWRRASTTAATLLLALRLVIALVSGVWLALASALDGFARELDEGWSAIRAGPGETASGLSRLSYQPARLIAGGLARAAREFSRAARWHLEFVDRLDRWGGAQQGTGKRVAG
jgi:hypothetical protein